jgi:hypothetical protein
MYLTSRRVGARTEYSLRHDLLSSRRVKREGRRHVRIVLGDFPVITEAVVADVADRYPSLQVDWPSLLSEARAIILARWPGATADWLLARMATV